MRRLLATVLAGVVLAGVAYFAVDLVKPVARPPAGPSNPSSAPPPAPPVTPPGDSHPPPRPRQAPREESSTRSGCLAAPDTATLHITSDVPGTMVFIDRKYLGDAPATAQGIMPGPHRLNAAKAGYDGIAEQIEVAAGTRTIHLRMADRRR